MFEKTFIVKPEVCSRVFWRDVIIEFVATFVLMSIHSALPLSWGNRDIMGGPVQVGLGMGLITAVLVTSFGDLGGAHMNPALTIPLLLRGQISLLRG